MARSLALSFAPLALAALVMLPRLASPQFGLLDDGLTLQTGREMRGRWSDVLVLIPETGRFFPAYWLVYSGIANAVGTRPLAFFTVNVLLFTALLAMLGRIVRVSGGTRAQAGLAMVFLAASGPVIETFYTLSKAEPLQMTWIGVSLLATAASTDVAGSTRRAALIGLAAATSLLAHATKETSVVLVPISLGWLMTEWWSTRKSETWARFAGTYLVINVVAAAAFFTVRSHYAALALADGTYTRAYALHPGTIGPAAFRIVAWLARDFAFLVPVLAAALVSLTREGETRHRPIVFAAIWMAGWLAVYLPWPATFEYYLLPFAFGAAVLAGTVVGDAWGWCGREQAVPRRRRLAYSLLVASGLLWLVAVMNAAADARVQLVVDRANADLVAFLGGVSARSRVVLNMSPVNEYHFELPMHLLEIQGRSDVAVEPVPPSGPLARSETDVFVVTPEVANQPGPSVRIAGHEAGVKSDNARLGELLAGGAELVYRTARQTRLVELRIHRLLCPFAVGPFRDVTYCPSDRGLIEDRTFSYGWQVHKLGRTTLERPARPI